LWCNHPGRESRHMQELRQAARLARLIAGAAKSEINLFT